MARQQPCSEHFTTFCNNPCNIPARSKGIHINTYPEYSALKILPVYPLLTPTNSKQEIPLQIHGRCFILPLNQLQIRFVGAFYLPLYKSN